jgi:hypothetical protein
MRKRPWGVAAVFFVSCFGGQQANASPTDSIGIAPLTLERYSNWAYGPNSYVFGKALWRGHADPKDIDEYCADVYGPAAGTMRAYFDMLFELTATAMETCGYSIPTDLRFAPAGQPSASCTDTG